MCGITGIIDYSNNINNKNNILKMNKSIIHRGPDQQGTFIDRNVALGHVRLSIIDLSENGKQPMSDNTEEIQIVFNGEIYNFQEIKKELKEFEFKSKTDTEVIIYGYKKWGLENTLSKFNGMFAFCLWDKRKNEGYLVRDRFGKKPLYYTVYNGAVIFASEIKAILSLDFIKREVDEESLYYYLSFLCTPAPKTMFKGIYKIPAGHYLKINKKIELIKYFNINDEFKIDYNLKLNIGLLNKLEDHLVNSVRLRQISDVPQGVYLSGGVDSSLLVALNSKIKKDSSPIKTFSVIFEDKSLNEEKYSDMVAKQYNTEHYKEILDEKRMFKGLDNIIYYGDEPIADPVALPLYYLSERAKKEGVTVVHVGEGADELFCGYDYYKFLNNTYFMFKWSNYVKFVSQPLVDMIPKSKNTVKVAADYMYKGHVSSRHILAFYDNEKDFVKNKENYNTLNKILEYAKYKSTNKDEFFYDIRTTEFNLRLPELLFMRLDKYVMANSMEARAPFLDYNLMKFGFSIPSKMHMHNGVPKYLLKKVSERHLPKELLYRKKVGFGAPLQSFFEYYADNLEVTLKKDFMKNYFDINKLDQYIKEKNIHRFKLWALLNYSLWYERWINE